jgi:hypothetical protein
MNIRRTIEFDPELFPGPIAASDMPYIYSVDVLQEFVILYNPRNEYFPLDGYSIADGKMYHNFKFPSRCIIPPCSEYCIYTCPGSAKFDHGTLMEFHVLWTNQDGSLRRMEVLNNGTKHSILSFTLSPLLYSSPSCVLECNRVLSCKIS